MNRLNKTIGYIISNRGIIVDETPFFYTQKKALNWLAIKAQNGATYWVHKVEIKNYAKTE